VGDTWGVDGTGFVSCAVCVLILIALGLAESFADYRA
jgi:hypothetical protein